jgi:hypothetical protein
MQFNRMGLPGVIVAAHENCCAGEICDDLTGIWRCQNPIATAGVLGPLAGAQQALVGNAKGPGAVSYAGAVMCVLSGCCGVINLRLRLRLK